MRTSTTSTFSPARKLTAGSFMFGAGYFKQKEFFALRARTGRQCFQLDSRLGGVGLSGSGTLPRVRVSTRSTLRLRSGEAGLRGLLCHLRAGQEGLHLRPAHVKAGATYSPEGWRVRRPGRGLLQLPAVNYLVTPSQRISLFGNGEVRIADSREPTSGDVRPAGHRFLVARRPFVTTGNPDLVIQRPTLNNPFGVP